MNFEGSLRTCNLQKVSKTTPHHTPHHNDLRPINIAQQNKPDPCYVLNVKWAVLGLSGPYEIAQMSSWLVLIQTALSKGHRYLHGRELWGAQGGHQTLQHIDVPTAGQSWRPAAAKML